MEDSLVRLLKIKHMRLISAIAEYGQLGKAADIMSITQPAASRMLAEIEGIVGVPLFERCAKGMRSTAIGQVIANRSSDILLELRDLSREIEELKDGQAGVASVGAVNGAALNFILPAILKIKAISPNSEIHINVETSSILIRDLLEGKNDFVLARLLPDMDLSEFKVEPVRSELIRLVVGKDHPLAGADEVSITELVGYEWVLQKRPSPLREAIDATFTQAGISPPTDILYTSALSVTIAALMNSTSVAPLPSEVTDLLANPNLKTLAIKEPITMAPYYFLQMKGRRLSPLADRLKAMVMNELHPSSA